MTSVLFDTALGIFLAFDFYRSLKTGSSVLFFGRYKRSEDPPRYWAAVSISGLGAVVLMSMSVLRAF